MFRKSNTLISLLFLLLLEEGLTSATPASHTNSNTVSTAASDIPSPPATVVSQAKSASNGYGDTISPTPLATASFGTGNASGTCTTCTTCEMSYAPYNALDLYRAEGWPLPSEYIALASYATMTSWPGTKSFGPFPKVSNASSLAARPRPSTEPTKEPSRRPNNSASGSLPTRGSGMSLSTMSTLVSTTPTDHFCSPTFKSIGPDAISAWCTCKNGGEIPTLPTITHGTWPCPTSDIPTQVTIHPGPVITKSATGEVYGCFHTLTYASISLGPDGSISTVTNVTECVGSTTVLSTRVTPTIRVEASTGTGAFVGQMGTASATALAFNVSSAIMDACTETASDGSISCPSSATIPGVPYPSEGNTEIGYGDVTFGFGGGTLFENDTMLAIMANATGHAAAHSVLRTGDNCKTVHVQGSCPHDGSVGCLGNPDPYEFPMCTAASSLIIEFYDGVATDGPTNAIWITLEFTDPSGLSVIDVLESACEAAFAAIDFANAFLLLFKEVPVVGQFLSAGTIAAEDIVRGTCAAIDGVAHGTEDQDG